MNKIKLTAVMLIWGSIGLFTKNISLSPMTLSFFRAVLAIPVLLIYLNIKKVNLKIPFRTILPYAVSGVLLGFGWASLLYGYKNADTSSAAIIYNMCPIYVMAVAPIILKERFKISQAVIILTCFAGLVLVVGTRSFLKSEMLGLALSALSGMIYASIVILNRKIKHKLDGSVSALIQISCAALVLMPFSISGGGMLQAASLNIKEIVMTVILGTVHTGLAYSLFFSSYKTMRSIDIVSFSYLEPVFCIILGVMLLGETLTALQIAGAVLILGSTYVGQYISAKKRNKEIAEAVEETI